MHIINRWIIAAGLLLCGSLGYAAFVADEFNAPTLDPHWAWTDGTPAGSTWALTGSALRLTATVGSDHSFVNDKNSFLEQDAPEGTDWEVSTRIDNFHPLDPKYMCSWNKSGIQIHQDNDHWICICVTSNGSLKTMGIQGSYQCDPVHNRKEPKFQDEQDYWHITSSTVYLKIRKSRAGYVAYCSGDNTDWYPVTPLMRNLGEEGGGSFIHEKVRLFQSGGLGKTGHAAPADFDYLRVTRLEPEPRGFKSDEFAGGTLNPNVWRRYEGFYRGDCGIKNGRLQLTGNILEDVWEDADVGTFVYQDAPTSPTNWCVKARVSPTNMRSYPMFNGYGLMVWQDQNNWVLISNLVAPEVDNLVEVGAQQQDGKVFNGYRGNLGYKELPAYLRIMKIGETYRCGYSFDDITWNELPPKGIKFPEPLKNAQIRFFVKQITGKIISPVVAECDWIRQVSLMDSWNIDMKSR